MTENTEPEEKKIDPEVEEDLRDYLLFTDDATFPWVPKPFRESKLPPSKWPVFKLKGKSGSEFIKDEDDLGYKSDKKKGLTTRSGTAKWDTLRTHIKGWNSNVKDTSGRVINFMEGNGGLSRKILDKFPPKLMSDIYEAILNQSTMTKEELTGLEL